MTAPPGSARQNQRDPQASAGSKADNENGRPGKGGPESSTATKNATIVPPTGCPCGCVAGEPCVTERAIPDRDPFCCGSYGVDSLQRGYGCPQHTRRAS